MYINGVQTGSAAFTGVIAPANVMSIGYNASFGGDYFPGVLAHVALYKSALSASRLLAHYTAGVTL